MRAKTTSRSYTRRSGFTLIELLTAIAIIAVLAAVLFPVFAAAKTRAKIAACMDKHKQLSGALLSYVSDWNNRFPYGAQVNRRVFPPVYTFWPETIKSYSGNSLDIAWCSECPAPEKTYASWLTAWYASIGANMAVLGLDTYRLPPISTADIGTPSKTIMLGCSACVDAEGTYYNAGACLITPGTQTRDTLLMSMQPRVNPQKGSLYCFPNFDPARHNGSVPVTHCDGHTSIYQRDQLLTLGISVSDNRTTAEKTNPKLCMWDLY